MAFQTSIIHKHATCFCSTEFILEDTDHKISDFNDIFLEVKKKEKNSIKFASPETEQTTHFVNTQNMSSFKEEKRKD